MIPSTDHFIARCIHGVTIAQCRCAEPGKSVRVVPCPPSCSQLPAVTTDAEALVRLADVLSRLRNAGEAALTSTVIGSVRRDLDAAVREATMALLDPGIYNAVLNAKARI